MKLKEKIKFGEFRLTEATKGTDKAPGKVRGEFYLDYTGDKMELATVLPTKFFTDEVTPPAGVKIDTIEFVSKSEGQYGIGWNFVFSAEVDMTDEDIKGILFLDALVGDLRKQFAAERREIDALRRKIRTLEGAASKTQRKIENVTFPG